MWVANHKKELAVRVPQEAVALSDATVSKSTSYSVSGVLLAAGVEYGIDFYYRERNKR